MDRDALDKKRGELLQAREEERLRKVAEIKAGKTVKEAERRAQAEREAKRAEVERRREENIAKKEAEREAKRAGLERRREENVADAPEACASPKRKTCKYKKADVMLLKKVFDRYDRDKSGVITTADLTKALGEGTLGDASTAMFKYVDNNGNRSLLFSQLLRIVFPLANQHDVEVMGGWAAPPPPPEPLAPSVELTAEQLAEMAAIFELYDKDGSGTLTFKELKDELQSKYLSGEDLNKMFEEVDVNNDKIIQFDEFCALMRSTGMWTSA